MKLNFFLGKILKTIFLLKVNSDQNTKFPPLDKKDILERVRKLQNILKIEKIECKILSEKTILIKPFKN